MKKELERLMKMRKENRISESDFHMLTKSLSEKSFCSILESSALINPFQKIAGFKALLIGIIIMVVMSLLGVYANIYIDGSLGFIVANGLKVARKPSFLLLLYQNTVACLCLAGLFFFSAILLGQKRIRLVDFLGTVTFARYPICVSIVLFMIENWLTPDRFNGDYSKLHFSIIGSLGALLWSACYIWQGMNYFFAFKESSGLDGKRLWSAFLFTMVIADIVSINLTRIFLYT